MEIKKIQSFKDLNVWNKSSDLAVAIYKLTDRYPKSEFYGLSNQMRRAIISVSSNIAEGFKRHHRKEKIQFYNIAYGSIAEIESQIEISKKLNFVSEEDYQKIILDVVGVSKMIDGLIKSVQKRFLSSHGTKLSVFAFLLYPISHILIFIFCIFFPISYILYPIPSADASTLYFLPQSQNIYSGETFILDARIDTEGKIINVINGTIEYPSDKVEVVDISDGDSILPLWVEKPSYSNEKGEIGFVGGVPNGFIGQGDIFKIVFRSKNVSAGEINFTEKTKVLLNDGNGTEDQLKYLPTNFEISKKSADLPLITSRSNPDQNSWYGNKDLSLHWDLVDGAEYSFLISWDPIAEVDEIPDKPEGKLIWMGDINYNGLDDGIYYFHLRQRLPDKEWSGKVTFRAMIDATSPEGFTPEITEIEEKKYLVFNAKDMVSGIDHYEVLEEENWQVQGLELGGLIPVSNIQNPKSWIVAASPYLLRDQNLESNITIKAIDRAGNETTAEIHSKQKPVPIQIMIIIIIIIMMALAMLLWFASKRFIKLKHDRDQ